MILYNFCNFFIQHWPTIRPHAEFRTMVVAGAGIKINKNFPIFQRFEKTIKIKFLKHGDFGVVVKFFVIFFFHFGLNVETVKKFSAGFVFQIVKAPVRLRIKLA